MIFDRPPRVGRPPELPLWAVALLSVVAHGVALGVLVLLAALGFGGAPGTGVRHKPRAVALRSLDAHQWAINRGGAAPEELRPSAARPILAHAEPITGQIVDVAPGNDRVAPDAKYLAETNNRVQKQTRARDQVAAPGKKGEAFTTAGPAAHDATVSAHPLQTKGGAPSLADRLRGFDGRTGRASLTELLHGAGRDDDTPEATPSETTGAGTAETGPRGLTQDAVGSGASGAANDDLDDVEEGKGTFLNTRAFLFASFFNRVKQAVAAHWDPEATLRTRGEPGAVTSRTTILTVTIDRTGRVTDVFVAQGSGMDALDAEAMRAFERSGPFPNPPAALFAQRDRVSFRFGFRVDEGMAGMPLMFRQR